MRGPGMLKDVEVTGAENEWHFTMPAANVEVSAFYIKTMSNPDITVTVADVTYNQQPQTPTVVVKDGEVTLEEGVDYTVTYSNNTNAALATDDNAPTATITGIGENYAGEILVTFNIFKATITAATFVETNLVYNQQEQSPVINQVLAGELVVPAEGYVVTNNKATNVGNYTATITGQGNYQGSVTAQFSIIPADAQLFAITLVPEEFTYNGQEQKPTVTVKDGETTLVEGTDYTLAFSPCINAGTVIVTATGKGNYAGTQTATYVIKKAPLKTVVLDETLLIYNEEIQTVNVVEVYGGEGDVSLLVDPQYYEVSGNSGKDVNTYTVTVTANELEGNNFTGSATTTFQIVAKVTAQTPAVDVEVPEFLGRNADGVPDGSATDLTWFLNDYLKDSPNPAYIKLILKPGAHYTVSGSLRTNAAISIIGDNENPAIVDGSNLKTPLVQIYKNYIPEMMNENGFFTSIYRVDFQGIIFSAMPQPLFHGNALKYLIEYFNFDHCIAEYVASKIPFNFENGGGSGTFVENFTISNSTIYGKVKHEASIFSSQSGPKANQVGVEKQKFFIENSTLYNMAYKKNTFSLAQKGQSWLSFTVKNNVILDCGKQNQFCKGLDGGQASANPTYLVQYNSFMWTNDNGLLINTDESTGDPVEEVSGSYLNPLAETEVTAIFPKWNIVSYTDEPGVYDETFRGNFTLAAGSVQRENAIGDPRWLKDDNEYTEIKTIDAQTIADKYGDGAWYNMQGVRIDQPTAKGLYIHNGKKIVVK